MNAVVQSKPKLPGLISLLLVVALGISLAKLLWLVLTPERKINTQAEEISDVGSTQKAKVNYGKLIANQHLFGEIKREKVVIKEPPKPEKKVVAPTKLNLKLHGIVAYKSKEGFALISLNNGPQKVYGKGDELKKGVSVHDIFPGKVILDNNGQTEELVLPVKQISTPASKQKRRESYPIRKNKTPQSKPENTPPPASKTMRGALPDLTKFRREVIANPKKLMDIATVSPAIVDDKFLGFRVQPGSQRIFFRQLGLRSNDIITEVNGIALDDASKGAIVFANLVQAAELSIKVMRGDQEVFIQHAF